jgi:hypothetical protein
MRQKIAFLTCILLFNFPAKANLEIISLKDDVSFSEIEILKLKIKSNNITLKLRSKKDFEVLIFNSYGKLIEIRKVTKNQRSFKLNFENYEDGEYSLNINNKEIRSFRKC